MSARLSISKSYITAAIFGDEPVRILDIEKVDGDDQALILVIESPLLPKGVQVVTTEVVEQRQ